MSRSSESNTSESAQASQESRKGITISSESIIGTLLGVLVIVAGWALFGYINNAIADNPRISEILATQKELQKDIQELRTLTVKLETKLTEKFESYDRLMHSLDTALNGRPTSGGGS